MKSSNPLTRLTSRSTIALCAAVLLSMNLHAADRAAGGEKLFTSPDDAIKALQSAAEAKDKDALRDIFGPQVDQLLTGDAVQDANNAQRFAAAMAEGYKQEKGDDGTITVEIGRDNWPMPIPLVSTDGQWYFDTAAGKEEVINRHIGKDELHAIGVCRAYVKAQEQYASLNPAAAGEKIYARHLKSTPGKKDGLYWPATTDQTVSPFGPLVDAAAAEGYDTSKGAHQPFHGYYFKILTCQGEAAPGGKLNYLKDDSLVDGFALIAYPEHWDQSGIMTFIVNQDGKVYQRNLGKKTVHIAKSLKEYNPDSNWELVQDEGVLDTDANSEK
jgi:hypothetical protein